MAGVSSARRERTIPGMSKSPKILAIETSGRVGAVALARGANLEHAHEFRADHNHAVELLPTISRLCHEAGWSPSDLEHLYLSIGPGSFTGLRIAVTLARTLALAVQVKIVVVSTLRVLAQNALLASQPPRHLAVILDAKRGQVYAAPFQHDQSAYRQTSESRVVDPAEFLAALPEPRFLLGQGIPFHAEALRSVPHECLPKSLWLPRVETVCRLGFERAQQGQFQDPSTLTPLYLRRPEAEEVWEKKHGQGTGGTA